MIILIVVLEVITEQRVGNLENLHRINREEYEKIESQQKRLENGEYAIYNFF